MFSDHNSKYICIYMKGILLCVSKMKSSHFICVSSCILIIYLRQGCLKKV